MQWTTSFSLMLFFHIYLKGGPQKSFNIQKWDLIYKKVENLWFIRF